MSDCRLKNLGEFNRHKNQGDTRVRWGRSVMTQESGDTKVIGVIGFSVKRVMQLRRHREERSDEHQRSHQSG